MARDRRTIGPRRERRVARSRRLRRTPEQARQELLDAADRVFSEFTPDEVGLKKVAREAGVSHSLITHYFGTYAGLVEATLERRIRAMRAKIVVQLRQAGALARPNELLGLLFETLQDPIHLKLVKWLVASERVAALRGLAFQEHGLQLIASEVAQALSPPLERAAVDTIGLALLTAVAAAYGYALNKHALAAGLGRVANAELDADVQRTLAAMLQAFLRSRLGPVAPV